MYVEDGDACVGGEVPEGAREGVSAFFKLVKGLLVDVYGANIVPQKYAQVDSFVGESKGCPGGRVGPRKG